MDSAISFSNIIYLALLVLIIMALRSAIKVVPQSENWLVERLGKYNRKMEAGLHVLIPFIEVLLRPVQGSGIENAPVLVQHLGLLFSLAGAVYAERTGHLTSLGSLWQTIRHPLTQKIARAFVFLFASHLCGVLALGSYDLVLSEIESGQVIAYGVPTWLFLCALPVGFCILAIQLGRKSHDHWLVQWIGMLLVWLLVAPVNEWLIEAAISTTSASIVLLVFLIVHV